MNYTIYKEIENLIDEDDRGHAILFVLKGSAGDVFLSSALLPSIMELFPDKHIYFATSKNLFDILKDNPYIHKVIPYRSEMELKFIPLEGILDIPGIFSVVYTPAIITQYYPNYHHNGLLAHNLDFRG